MRFWKFRARGWKAEAKTLDLMKEMLPKMLPKQIRKELKKIMLKGGDPKANWAKLRGAMIEDGAYELYQAHIKPHKQKAINK